MLRFWAYENFLTWRGIIRLFSSSYFITFHPRINVSKQANIAPTWLQYLCLLSHFVTLCCSCAFFLFSLCLCSYIRQTDLTSVSSIQSFFFSSPTFRSPQRKKIIKSNRKDFRSTLGWSHWISLQALFFCQAMKKEKRARQGRNWTDTKYKKNYTRYTNDSSSRLEFQ